MVYQSDPQRLHSQVVEHEAELFLFLACQKKYSSLKTWCFPWSNYELRVVPLLDSDTIPYESMETLNLASSRLGIFNKATLTSLCRNGSWHFPQERSEVQLLLHSFLTTINLTDRSYYFGWEIDGKILEKFFTGKVYTYLRGTIQDFNWSSIVWTSYNIPRHNFHTWLMVLNRCPTRDRLLSWGLQTSPHCLLCNRDHESGNHISSSSEVSATTCGPWLQLAAIPPPTRSWDATSLLMKGLPTRKNLWSVWRSQSFLGNRRFTEVGMRETQGFIPPLSGPLTISLVSSII